MLKDLGRYEHASHPIIITEATRTLLSFIMELLSSGSPRAIYCNDPGVMHVFTDGIEGVDGQSTITSVGAVLVDSSGSALKAFGMTIDKDTTTLIGSRINQIEILPVVLACVAFESELRSQAVMFHIDSAAAQSALINAGSSNVLSRSLVYVYLDLDSNSSYGHGSLGSPVTQT